jgi:hypothetical protein
MPKRSRTPPRAASAPVRPQGRQPRPGIVHTSVYSPQDLYEALREAAFRERRKIHDIVLEGIELALRKRGRRVERSGRSSGPVPCHACPEPMPEHVLEAALRKTRS